MDLWIRSQDKECLIKTNIVEIEYFGENSFTSINTRFDGRNASLGLYKTKERALEVLDEIQNILKPVIFLKQGNEEHTLLGARQAGVTSKLETEFKELSTYVYEMPKE